MTWVMFSDWDISVTSIFFGGNNRINRWNVCVIQCQEIEQIQLHVECYFKLLTERGC